MSALRGLRALTLAACSVFLLSGCGGGTTTTSTTTLTNGGTFTTVSSTTNAATSTVCPASNIQNTIANNGPTGQASTIYMDLCPISTPNANNVPQLRLSANIPYVSIYLCAPGSTTNCAWIDHIEVDTGSEGLRVLSSAIPANVLAGMPTLTAANFAGGAPAGNIGECYAFVSSFFWGGVRSADLTLGGTVAPPGNPGSTGLTAHGLSLQVLNDSTLPAGPPSGNCNISGQTSTNWVNTATDIRANGILGIGLFADDCHSSTSSTSGRCSLVSSPAAYYSCANNQCTPIGPTLDATGQPIVNFPIIGTTVANPVSAVGKNGTSLTLNSAATSNSTSIAGAVTYGITATPSHAVLVADSGSAFITSTVNGINYPVVNYQVPTTPPAVPKRYGGGSYIDSGSNAIYFSNNTANTTFPDQKIGGLSTCANVVAPFACTSNGAPITLAASMGSFGSPTGTFTISPAPVVNDATTLFGTNGSPGPAYEGLTIVDPGYTSPGVFAWGLPFFFSRTIYFGIYDGTPGTPYYGF